MCSGQWAYLISLGTQVESCQTIGHTLASAPGRFTQSALTQPSVYSTVVHSSSAHNIADELSLSALHCMPLVCPLQERQVLFQASFYLSQGLFSTKACAAPPCSPRRQLASLRRQAKLQGIQQQQESPKLGCASPAVPVNL